MYILWTGSVWRIFRWCIYMLPVTAICGWAIVLYWPNMTSTDSWSKSIPSGISTEELLFPDFVRAATMRLLFLCGMAGYIIWTKKKTSSFLILIRWEDKILRWWFRIMNRTTSGWQPGGMVWCVLTLRLLKILCLYILKYRSMLPVRRMGSSLVWYRMINWGISG